MRVLLDCVDEQLRHHLPGRDCQTARYAGFAGLANGDFSKGRSSEIRCTVDRGSGFEYQQNLADRQIAVIVFCGKSVLFEDLLPLMTTCLDHLKTIRPGEVIRIGD